MNFKTRFSLLIVTTSLLCALPAQGSLLAYYPFDEDFSDSSGNENHLLISEGEPTIITSEGDFVFGGGALDTDSTVGDREFLELTDPIVFEATDPWSIIFWARRRAGSDQRQGMVVGDVDNTTDFIWLSDNPAQVQGVRFRSSDNTNFNYEVGEDDAEWHHWALVADGTGALTVYRDNVSLGTQESTTTFSLKNVAQAYNTDVHSMNGQIDELSIYDEALEPAAIAALYTGPAAEELAITQVFYATGSNEVTLTWASIPGQTYAVKFSRDLTDWSGELDDAIEADPESETTTVAFDLSLVGPTAEEKLFFRVEKP